MTIEHRHVFHLIRGIMVELINAPKELGATRDELYGEADRWANYADAVSRGSAESIVVEWVGTDTIGLHIVRRTT